MPDNSFTVGAAVDVSQLAAGMNQAGQVTKAALDKMLVDFGSASGRSKAAVNKISDDTRAAALNVGESWQRVTLASLAYTGALKEVSAATYLARSAGEDDAATTALLAAAKQKAAAAALELKVAQEATAASTEKVAGAMGMARVEAGALTGSTSMVVGGMARIAAQSETLGPIIQAAFVPFAIAAFADILFQVGEKIYHVYQNVVLLKSSIEALDKASEAEAVKAADLNYQYEEAYAKRLETTGHLKEAQLELQKAEADKPLTLPKIDDKEFKQFNAEFVTFLQSVHTASDAPTVLTRINAEAKSTAEQLDAAKKRAADLAEAQKLPGYGEGVDFAAVGQIKHADEEITDLTKKLALLQTMAGTIQSQTGIAYENATTKMAEASKKPRRK